MRTGSLFAKILLAAKLRPSFYREVSQERTFGREAFMIVIIAGVANGLGTAAKTARPASLLAGIIVTLGAYFLWSWLIHLIGNKLFASRADSSRVRRAVGYAHSPYILTFFGFLPFVGGLLDVVGGLWLLLAGVVATKHSLDVSGAQAVLVAVAAWVLVSLIAAIVLVGTPLARVYF